MKERRYGRIVNLSSIAAMGTSFVGNTFYGATKAAVLLLTRRFAMDLGPFGITVNAIAPGFIVTDMVHQGRSPEETQALIGRIAEKAMTRRTGTPEDTRTPSRSWSRRNRALSRRRRSPSTAGAWTT